MQELPAVDSHGIIAFLPAALEDSAADMPRRQDIDIPADCHVSNRFESPRSRKFYMGCGIFYTFLWL